MPGCLWGNRFKLIFKKLCPIFAGMSAQKPLTLADLNHCSGNCQDESIHHPAISSPPACTHHCVSACISAVELCLAALRRPPFHRNYITCLGAFLSFRHKRNDITRPCACFSLTAHHYVAEVLLPTLLQSFLGWVGGCLRWLKRAEALRRRGHLLKPEENASSVR